MVDSRIENIHRDDLTPTEKGKFCLQIKKQMKLENNEQIANVLKVKNSDVVDWIDNYQINKTRAHVIPWKITRATKSMTNKEREKIFDYTKRENKDSMFIEREFVPIYKKSDEPTKKAKKEKEIETPTTSPALSLARLSGTSSPMFISLLYPCLS